ncbi:MAG: hypothetical protein KGH61_01010 [Candidatus Micrarchaeota archaeon]|nr:hypothetical protein [Candidatus Micrarchaeota archaeon]MDE1847514.1 hypothetical protein [Candidatus Micrarchaeota archaeon]MDE1863850.1 hypothetical protein [Candidatus Micrarchaeota archaeon]
MRYELVISVFCLVIFGVVAGSLVSAAQTTFVPTIQTSFTISSHYLNVSPKLSIGEQISSLTSVLWSWGDGSQTFWTASDGQQALSSFPGNHIYSQQGTYNLSVEVIDKSDNTGASSQLIKLSVPSTSSASNTVSSGPYAIGISFTVSVHGLNATPTYTLSDPNANTGASLTQIDWSWGDGSQDTIWLNNGYPPSSLFPGTHTYSSSGQYTISVNAIDSADASGLATEQVQVGSSGSSSANKTAASQNPLQTNFTLVTSGYKVTPTYTINDSNLKNGATLTYIDWSWGDGSSDTTWLANGYSVPENFPGNHTYPGPGYYTITELVIDSADATGTASHQEYFPFPSSNSPTAETLTNSLSSIQVSFSTLASGLSATPTAVVNDSNTGPSLSLATLSWGDGTTSAVWTASDGLGTLAGFAGTHVYSVAGNYILTLTATDSANAKGSISQRASLANSGSYTLSSPSSIAAASTISTNSLTVTPQLQISDPNLGSGASVTLETWSWGDGTVNAIWTPSQQAAAQPSAKGSGASDLAVLAASIAPVPPSTFPGPHTYSKSGSYTVTGTVLDSEGGSGTASQNLLVGTSSPSSQASPSNCTGVVSQCTIKNAGSCTVTCPIVSGNVVASSLTTYPAGQGFSTSNGPTTTSSPIGQVNSTNEAIATWLLTCPSTPEANPMDNQYFTANPYFAGDECTPHQTSTEANLIIKGNINNNYYPGWCGGCIPYNALNPYPPGWNYITTPLAGTPRTATFQSNSTLNVSPLGYSAEFNSTISSDFSTNSYVFTKPTPFNQHALWTWNAEVPKLNSSVSYIPSNRFILYEGQPANNLGWSYQWEVCIPQGGCYGNSCSYNYTYYSNTTIEDLNNSGIPYTEVDNLQTGATSSFFTDVLPYLTYNLSMPSPYGQNLNLSYYLFSPWKYSSPANNLGTLPISSGSQFYVSYAGTLAMSPQQNFQSQWQSQPKNTVTEQATNAQWDLANPAPNVPKTNAPFCTGAGFQNVESSIVPSMDSLYCRFCDQNYQSTLCTNPKGEHSAYTYANYSKDCLGAAFQATPFCQGYSAGTQTVEVAISNPMSITSLPNDFTFVLSKKNSSYYLYVLRSVPKGRYVTTNFDVPPAPNSQVWDMEWYQYWSQLISAQNDTTYIYKAINLSQTSLSSFTPINMSADYLGDAFLTGFYSVQNSSSGTTSNTPALAEIDNITAWNYSKSKITIGYNSIIIGGSNSIPVQMMPEIAASPTGTIVFLANQSDGGYIYAYSGHNYSFPYINSVNLAYQRQNKSGSSAILNITYWLSNKGLYSQQFPWISSFLGTYRQTSQTNFDSSIYHHPVGMQDVDGYLYILDNWAGGADVNQTSCNGTGQCNYKGIFFSALTLRVINTTGTNLAVGPTTFDDLFQTGTCSITPANALSTSCVSTPPSAVSCSKGCTLTYTSCSAAGKPASTRSYLCTAGGTHSANYTSLSTASFSAQNTYPPYGWIISANVTAAELDNIGDSNFYSIKKYGTYSLCGVASGSYACNFTPSNATHSGYLGSLAAIGPHIIALDTQSVTGYCFLGLLCFGNKVPQAIRMNGDIRGAFSPYFYDTGFSVSFNQSISLLFTNYAYQGTAGHLAEYTYTAENPNLYSELLFTTMNAQNYTKVFQGDSQYTCYTNQSIAAQLGSACQGLSAIDLMSAPLYNMPDPFQYLESTGGQFSTFPEAVGASLLQSSSSQASLQKCASSIANTGAPPSSGCNGASSAQSAVSGALGLNSSTAGATAGAVGYNEPLTLAISGDVYIPYDYYTYLIQEWTNFNGWCHPFDTQARKPPKPYRDHEGSVPVSYGAPQGLVDYYTYTGTSTPQQYQSLTLPLQGGTVYLSNDNAYYQQNLSDAGSIVSPHLSYVIQSPRQLSDLLINLTTNNLHGGDGSQYIINATHQLNYFITTYAQNMGGKQYPGYQLLFPNTTNASNYGQQAASAILGGQGQANKVPANYASGNSALSYLPTAPSVLSLFSFVGGLYTVDTKLNMQSNLQLPGSPTYNTLGYNRMVYTFKDAFNNTISAPLDLDFAYGTSLSMNLQTSVNNTNANRTALGISGTLDYITPNGTSKPLPGAQVYIYYGGNINFAKYNPQVSPTQATLCEFGKFGSPDSPTNCTLANPLNPTTYSNAGVVTFHTDYNAQGDCGPPPQALLANTTINCNIYSTGAMSSSCAKSAGGYTQYCVPEFSNGTGVCTSQLGLIGAFKTGSYGNFSTKQTVCGIGSATVYAQFYGLPSPQPVTVKQTQLGLAASPSATCASGACTESTQVLNYSYFSSQTSQSAQIGLFELAYGNLGVMGLIACTAVALLILWKRR